MTAMRNRPFPFPRARSTIPAMPTLVQREADLSLRAARDFVRLRVSWPPDMPDGSPIALLLADRDFGFDAAQALCRQGGFLVLALQTAALDEATIALEWAGDHASSLGADPDQLVVAGGGLAAAAALHARDHGWPPLLRQVLIGPDLSGSQSPVASLAGVAPATVIDAPDHARRLREAGVEVEELSAGQPMSFGWIRRSPA
jgi:alpha/beta hydrolase family protein